MMNPISKCLFSTSAVRRRAGERRNIRESHFYPSLLLKSADDRQKKMQYPKTEDRKSIRKSARRTFLSLMCVSCTGYASREKLALILHIKGPSFGFPDRPRSEQHPCMWEGQGADA